MRATVMYGAGEVRVEDVPDARLIEPTDALVRVTPAAICGSDRSTGRLIDVAPRSSSTRAVAGFAAASVTEIFSTKSLGRSPAAFIRPSTNSWPTSATRTDRTPSDAACRTSSIP